MESMWILCGFHMESMWNPCGICISEYMIYVVKHIPCGIHVESMDSTWNKFVPHGFHVECGGMVKYCQNCWNRNIPGLNYNIISLPCVTTLSICFGEYDSNSDVFTSLISRLSLPALKDLNIVVGEKINVPWIPEFIRLILRSSWKLLKLNISAYSAEGASETQILEMLSHLPTLEHLSLDPQCKLSPKFFIAMDLSKTPAREALLPALRVLNLYHPGICTIYAALICMLESRIQSNSDNTFSSPSQTTLSEVQQFLSVKIDAFICDSEEGEYYRAEAQFIEAKILSLALN